MYSSRESKGVEFFINMIRVSKGTVLVVERFFERAATRCCGNAGHR